MLPGLNTEKPWEAGAPPHAADRKMEAQCEGLAPVLTQLSPVRPPGPHPRADLAGPSLPCA